MKKGKKKIKWFFIIFCVVAIIFGISSFAYIKMKEKKEQDHIQEIKDHYQEKMMVLKDTDLLTIDHEEIQKAGKVYQGEMVELEEIQNDYYKIKDTPYYIYYQDVGEKLNENPTEEQEKPYLFWNENAITKSPVDLYQNNTKVVTLEKTIEAPILQKKEDFYTVSIKGKNYQIPTEQIESTIEKENTQEEELKKISIFLIKESKNIEEKLEYLKEKNYTYIQEEDLLSFLNKEVRLKANSVMVLVENTESLSQDLIEKYNITVNNLENIEENYQAGDEQVEKKDRLVYYKVDSNTTLSRFKDMLVGKKEQKITTSVQKIAVLNYHFFYDETGGACNETICLEVKRFEEQLKYLKENGFKTLTMQEFNDWLDKKIELPKKSVLLTIDDGAMGTNTHLPALLAKYDLKATLFLISGWWPMSKYTVGNLEIQSHGHDLHHNDYCKDGSCGVKTLLLSDEELREDLKLSKQTIGDPIAFCFPFYAYNERVINVVKQEFSLAFIGGNQKASRNSNKYKIPRYIIYKNTSLESFKNMVN